MRGYGERKRRVGLLLLLLMKWKFLVAVGEMAKFVGHAPDHKEGRAQESGAGERSEGRKEGEAEIGIKRTLSKLCVSFSLARNWPALPICPFRYNDTRLR